MKDDHAKGPQGQRRPADAIGCAIMVGRIATGEITGNIEREASVMTDEAGQYTHLNKDFASHDFASHDFVNHGTG
jgi:hypothetical protein